MIATVLTLLVVPALNALWFQATGEPAADHALAERFAPAEPIRVAAGASRVRAKLMPQGRR